MLWEGTAMMKCTVYAGNEIFTHQMNGGLLV